MNALCGIVTPIGMLGYGFVYEQLTNGLEILSSQQIPASIIIDSGSTDSGPSKLALGTTTCPRGSYKRDLDKCIQAAKQYRVPLLIGSAGGDGSDEHVREFLDIIQEIMSEPQHASTKLKAVAIYSGVQSNVVLQKLADGHISGCGPCVPALTVENIEATPTIVAQIGPEPFLQVLVAHPDVDIVIGGRAYDPAPYVAWCAFHALSDKRAYRPVLALDPVVLGGFTHMGKIMECGGVCATPKSHSSLATIYRSGTFDIRALAPGAVCTPLSVAAHTLYEKSRPDHLHGPGGYIDLTASTYAQLADGISVRVQGTTFHASPRYTVKLEGAKVNGYRSIFIGSFCDPVLCAQLPALLEAIKAYVRQQNVGVAEKWDLGFHVYGLGAEVPRDVVVVGEALAETQALATSVASSARVACVHGPYKGQKATSGNMGFGMGGKGEIEMGLCADFSVYHLMELEDGMEEAAEVGVGSRKKLFTWEMVMIGEGKRIPPRAAAGTIGAPSPTLEPASSEAPLPLPTGRHTLRDLASVIRSKNAGPFEITVDIIFPSPAIFHHVQTSGVLTPALVASLYNIPVNDFVYFGFFEPALAFKVTLPRMRDGRVQPSGGFMEGDVHGSQKYGPLMDLEV
ncbi:hypothetical protein DFH07DRAFT_897577, partial [Mycena maculata]